MEYEPLLDKVKGESKRSPFNDIDASNAIVLQGGDMKPGDLEKALKEAEGPTLIIIEDIHKAIK